MTLNFDGQVAIITGAGRGIGREAALGLARRGAAVLVNDYGGGGDTLTPGKLSVAEAVVEEIREAGGIAAANGDSVGTGQSADTIVNHAMQEFGRVDILINNAGGARGIIPLTGDTDEQIEGVIRTNLLGPLMLMRRVWPIMERLGGGRIVNMMSGTVMGMKGTSAYVTGKAGLMGLTKTAALEGAPLNIKVNAVWPIGHTRLAGQLDDDAMASWMKQFNPSLVAEAMIFLASKENPATGEMYTAAGNGVMARNDVYGSPGFRHKSLTAELVNEHLDLVRNMNDARPMWGENGSTWQIS